LFEIAVLVLVLLASLTIVGDGSGTLAGPLSRSLALLQTARGHSGFAGPGSAPPGKTSLPLSGSDVIQTERSVGNAYYEQGEYNRAAAEFAKVVATGRAVALDHLDLGQALIQTNHLNRALEELTTAQEMAPHLLAIDFNLGILYKHELLYPKAATELNRVAAADPSDPSTWFNLGDVFFSEHKLERSLAAFKRVVDMGYARAQNFYVAATFHCFTILIRLGRHAEAQHYLQLNQASRDKVPSISLQSPALEAGKYGEMTIATHPPAPPPVSPEAVQVDFKDITATLGARLPHLAGSAYSSEAYKSIPASSYSLFFARHNLVPLFGGTVVTGDYNEDGFEDLYVVVPGGRNHLLQNDGHGKFTDVTAQAGVGGAGGSLAAEFVDYNNSGHPSLVVVGLGGVTLFKNNGNGTFTNITKQAGLAGNPCELDTDVQAVDTDNDGFLDLVVTSYTNLCNPSRGKTIAFPADFLRARVHLYHNNGDGTFTDVTSSSGLAAASGHWRDVVSADFSGNGYTDLLFLRDDGSPMLFLNQGDDRFVDGTAGSGPALSQSRATAAQVRDFNHDGKFDLALFGPDGYSVLLNAGQARFQAVPGLPRISPPRNLFAYRGAVADLWGDSFDDLLVKDTGGRWHALRNHLGHFREAPIVEQQPHAFRDLGTLASVVPTWLGSPGSLDLMGVRPDGQLAAFARQGLTAHWIEVRLQGYKSNLQGIGDIVELKAGDFYDKVLARNNPVRIFAGALPKLDVVRITWPNQIVENSIDVNADSKIVVKESSRLASSCPFLYVWNGRRFVFYTDVLGVSPLGELAPDGSVLRPNPQDLVRLGSSLETIRGNYVFQITDEMREVDYVDQLRLLAIDHPASEQVYANEIYAPVASRPRIYVFHHKRFPVSAIDGRGQNVLPLIRGADGRYPADFHRSRVLGVAHLHSLTLDLGLFPRSSHVALWLNGWVFWTDSNAARALMTNHRLQMTDPYLQVHNRAGKWVAVVPDIGLPSGTNRTMRVDLTGKFLTPDHHVRIVSSLCVYWDQIFFTTNARPLLNGWAAIRRTAAGGSLAPGATAAFPLPLVAANLHYRGFSQVTTDPRHVTPDEFDYTKLISTAPWNPASGLYTRYGDVRPLLLKADDQLAVLAPGDELTAKFSARRLPPLRAGWKRDFFLYVVGYAKDGEPNTKFSRSVAPLPFRSMSNYPPATGEAAPSSPGYRKYVREYETRPAYDLIPPLAPSY
jgi:Tfp pilus assembly protein PilF